MAIPEGLSLPSFDYQALGLTPSYSTTGGVETGDLQQTLEGYSKDNGNGTFTQYDTSGKLVSSSSPYSSIGQLAGSGAATLAKTIAPIAGAALIGGGLAGAGPLGGMLGGAGTAGAGIAEQIAFLEANGLTAAEIATITGVDAATAGAIGAGTAAGTGTVAGMGGGTGLTAGSTGLGLTTAGAGGGTLTAGGLTTGAGLGLTNTLTGGALGAGVGGTIAGTVAGTAGSSLLNQALGTGLNIAGGMMSANDARNLQNDQIAANAATLKANQDYADKQTKAAQDYAAKINQENINKALTVTGVSNDSINALTPLQQAAYAAQANATKTGLLSDAQLGNTAARYATEAGNQYAKGLNDVALNNSSVNNLYAGNYRTGMSDAAKTSADLMKFKPVGVSNRYGSSNATYDANGNLTGVGYTLSPEMKAQQDRLMGVSNNMLTQYEGAQSATAGMGQGAQSMFNLGNQYLASSPQEQAQKWMKDQQALLASGRESSLSSIQNKLAQQGRLGMSVGGTAGQSATNPEMAAYMNSIQQQDLGLAANATQAGQQYAQFGANMVNQGGSTLQNMYGTQNAAYSPYQTAMGGVNTIEGYGKDLLNQSLSVGQTNTNANTNAANQLYNGASAGLGAVYNTGIAGQNNMFNAASTGLNEQYKNNLNPAQYQEYLNWQRQGIGDQYIAQLNSGNAQAAYNTGSTLANQQAGYANKFVGTAANTPMVNIVNAPFAGNTQLQQTNPNYGGMLGAIGNNLTNGTNTGGAGLLSKGLNVVSNWWGS